MSTVIWFTLKISTTHNAHSTTSPFS